MKKGGFPVLGKPLTNPEGESGELRVLVKKGGFCEKVRQSAAKKRRMGVGVDSHKASPAKVNGDF